MVNTGWSLKAFREGIFDGRAGKLCSENPYKTGSEEALMWESGWKEGTGFYNDQRSSDYKVQNIT